MTPACDTPTITFAVLAVSGSVLIQCSLIQHRMSVSVIMVVLKSPMTTQASNGMIRWFGGADFLLSESL